MSIKIIEYLPKGHKTPIIFGVKTNGTTSVDIFALPQNEGSKISDHLIGVANHIIENELNSIATIDEFKFYMHASYAFSEIQFRLNNVIPTIHLTNSQALEWERAGNTLSIEKYEDEYNKKIPGTDISRERELSIEFNKTPLTVWAISCDHSSARDGVFYCQPSYFNHQTDSEYYRHYVAAPLDDFLNQFDPQMIEHTQRKHHAGDELSWLENNSILHAPEMGTFFINSNNEIDMGSGHAELVSVAKQIGLKTYPITCETESSFNEIMRRMGIAGMRSDPTFHHGLPYII